VNGLRILSLFSGIGGLELGLERAGLGQVVQQVEINPWCRAVLRRHWPDIAQHDDIRTFQPVPGSADIVCGGFPCQDISNAGKGAGIEEGTRSGLWAEYVRVLRVVRPRLVVVENVGALLRRGMGRVLGDLAALGYDAEWDCVPAAALGAPHLRDRVFILAYPHGSRHLHVEPGQYATVGRQPTLSLSGGGGEAMADANGIGRPRRPDAPAWDDDDWHDSGRPQEAGRPGQRGQNVADTGCLGREASLALLHARERHLARGGIWGPGWETEPRLGRFPDGLPAWVAELEGLGNAVVPAVSEFIGERARMILGLCCNKGATNGN